MTVSASASALAASPPPVRSTCPYCGVGCGVVAAQKFGKFRVSGDPAHPVSHLGLQTKPFYLESDDTFKAGVPLANFKFAVSYGDPQTVRVVALGDLGKVTLKYRINGGREQSATTDDYKGGERYGGKTAVYYHVVEGQVKGTNAGDGVEVWF